MTEQIKIHHNCQIQNAMRLHACSYLILHILYVYWFVFLVIALQEVTCSVNEIIYLFLDLFLAFLPLLYSNSQREREKERMTIAVGTQLVLNRWATGAPPPPSPLPDSDVLKQHKHWAVRMRNSCLKALLPQRTKLAAIEVLVLLHITLLQILLNWERLNTSFLLPHTNTSSCLKNKELIVTSLDLNNPAIHESAADKLASNRSLSWLTEGTTPLQASWYHKLGKDAE